MEQQKYNEAIFWFKLATEVPMATESPFHSPASYTWLPYLQMCICYSKLGEQDKAYYYNELAASYVPNNAAIEYNRKYFRSIFDQQKIVIGCFLEIAYQDSNSNRLTI